MIINIKLHLQFFNTLINKIYKIIRLKVIIIKKERDLLFEIF